MEQILIFLLSLPSVALHALFGATFGAMGVLVGVIMTKKIKSKKTSQAVAIVCLIFSIQISNSIVHFLQKEFVPKQIVKQLESNRLFAVIFRLHPEAVGEFETRYKELLKSNISGNELSLKSQEISAELVQKYFQKHLMSASDSATKTLLERNVVVMKSFKSQPSICVNYYLGKPGYDKKILTENFIKEETEIKADIIQSSINRPSFTKVADLNSLIKIIALSYKKKGYDLDNLKKIDQVETIPPEEGCKIATEFSDALASLDEKEAAYVFKNLLYLSQNTQKQ
jgi:hypothetical protein